MIDASNYCNINNAKAKELELMEIYNLFQNLNV
jgi:hypothetical protein